MKVSNSICKQINKLHAGKHRRDMQLFVIDGARIVEEAIIAKAVEYVVVCEGTDVEKGIATGTGVRFLDLVDIPTYVADELTFSKLAQTQNPQGILAVCRMRSEPELDDISSGDAVVMCDNVADPGNLGTIIRTAESAGISAVLLSSGCVDLYNAKTVRATMGAIFRIPVLTNQSLTDIIHKDIWTGVGMSLDGAVSLYDANFGEKTAIVIGSEAHGISAEVLQACKQRIIIPMSAGDSLNAAIAAGVTMYEWRRQRRRD